MKKNLVALCVAVLLFACQKEITSDNGGGTNNGGSGSGGGSNTGGDYQPVSANSKWNMKSTSLGDYTLTSLGTDSTVNGKKYYKFDNSAGGRQYISKENGVYTQYVYNLQLGGWVSLLYLKDAAAGTTWTETLSSGGIPVQMKYTVASVGGTRTINAKAYTNVIRITYVQSALGITTATGEQSFSKGVGPIEGISRIDLLGTSTTIDSTYVVSAVIN
ncbi:MAG TPA: hypothetical protein VM871_10480 [Flavisolibacter sp.]|jgi:hypothetical protein|nr:hypothetical protein [Flavisolibacter sp.]